MLKPSSKGNYKESIIHSFGGNGDLWYPYSSLTLDKNGNLYGTAAQDTSTDNSGTVYRLSPSGGGWNESFLFFFTTASTGLDPYGSVTFDAEGNLYGLTSRGGAYNDTGLAYKLTPAPSGLWNESILYNFGGVPNDAEFPAGGLTFDGLGNLYGTASGCLYENGCVFELTPTSSGPWQERVFSFSNLLIDSFNNSLVIDSSGNVLGTTFDGGSADNGTVFEITP